MGIDIRTARTMVKEYFFVKRDEERLNSKMEESRQKRLRYDKLREQLKQIGKNEFKFDEEKMENDTLELKQPSKEKVKGDFFGIIQTINHQARTYKYDRPMEKKFQLYRL